MKKYCIFAVSAIIALFTASCEKDDSAESGPKFVKLSSIVCDQYMGSEGQSEHKVYTLTYDGNDKLTKIDMERYFFSYDDKTGKYLSESVLDRKTVCTFTWKEGLTVDYKMTDVAYDDDGQGGRRSLDQGTRTGTYTFDGKGKVSEYKYRYDNYKYDYNYKFTYDGDYLIGGYYDGEECTYTWENGDLVSITDKENNTANFTYGTEANPIILGVNPIFLFYNEYSEDFTMGLTGRHPAHLPVKATGTLWSSEFENDFEYTKDGQGRLATIKITVPELVEGAYIVYTLNY